MWIFGHSSIRRIGQAIATSSISLRAGSPLVPSRRFFGRSADWAGRRSPARIPRISHRASSETIDGDDVPRSTCERKLAENPHFDATSRRDSPFSTRAFLIWEPIALFTLHPRASPGDYQVLLHIVHLREQQRRTDGAGRSLVRGVAQLRCRWNQSRMTSSRAMRFRGFPVRLRSCPSFLNRANATSRPSFLSAMNSCSACSIGTRVSRSLWRTEERRDEPLDLKQRRHFPVCVRMGPRHSPDNPFHVVIANIARPEHACQIRNAPLADARREEIARHQQLERKVSPVAASANADLSWIDIGLAAEHLGPGQ